MSDRQDKFEILWALRHDVPAESLKQYRFETKEGYRLPEMAAHYRTFCAALDSLSAENQRIVPVRENP